MYYWVKFSHLYPFGRTQPFAIFFLNTAVLSIGQKAQIINFEWLLLNVHRSDESIAASCPGTPVWWPLPSEDGASGWLGGRAGTGSGHWDRWELPTRGPNSILKGVLAAKWSLEKNSIPTIQGYASHHAYRNSSFFDLVTIFLGWLCLNSKTTPLDFELVLLSGTQ